MKKLVIGTVALFAFNAAGSAGAADLPTKASAYRAPPPIAYSWTGFYLGASGGIARSSGVKGDDCSFFCSDIDFIKEGGTFGGQVGFNYQYGSSVFGIEADFSWIDGDRTTTLCTGCTFGVVIASQRDFLGTARARFGLAIDRTLAYVTAGVAFSDGEDKLTAIRNNTGQLFTTFTQEHRFGWVVGGGVEQAVLNNFTVRLEALYHSFGSKTLNYVDPNIAGGDPVPLHLASSVLTARVGLNYKFGGPVVASY